MKTLHKIEARQWDVNGQLWFSDVLIQSDGTHRHIISKHDSHPNEGLPPTLIADYTADDQTSYCLTTSTGRGIEDYYETR